ncbi:MAG TPA: hypothetical protein VFR02_10410 [bacterium]|nr:hypothetical protein [bacterium]
MSTTVHYFGKIRSPELLRELKDELQEIAQVSGWAYEKVDHLFTPTDQAAAPARLTLKGIRLTLGKGLSPLQMTFDKDGYLSHIYYETVLTQNPLRPGVEKTTQVLHQVHTSTVLKNADPQDHVRLVKLLDYVKKRYVPNLEVIDNTGYWYSRDESVLQGKPLLLIPQ